MPISLLEHRKAIVTASIGNYTDQRRPSLGLAKFFPTKTTRAKLLALEIMRNSQRVAVDIQRGADPHRNTFGKSTEKLYEPPLYSEMVDFTSLQGYDITFGMGLAPNSQTADMMIESATSQISALEDLILRAIEKQRASILQSGTVVLKNGDSIDFKRKAASMVTKTSTAAWSATTTADPVADLTAGVEFLRNEGLSVGASVGVIMGQTAFSYLKANTKFLAEAAIFSQIRRIDIGMPQFDKATGMAYQGAIAAGDYLCYIYTYSDYYENADTTKTKYIDPLNVVILPDDFEGTTAYGGIPMVMDYNTPSQRIEPVEGDFLVHDLIDPKKKTWDIIVESAPLVIPKSIDRIYTIKVA